MVTLARDEAHAEFERRKNFTLAALAIFASFGSLTCRVKLPLENPVSELVVVPAKVGVNGGEMQVPFWVMVTNLLSRMSEGTGGPVVDPTPGAAHHLEFIHAEMVVAVVAFIFFMVSMEVIVRSLEYPWKDFDVVKGNLQ
ncbi:hypothetical protein V6N13_114043 [Hibiscus sabdariffa]|uniref:Uncharacterized protein n=1 Tax=Hibiscus sabdariffa TaxID=183260 RepID=A0ABR2U0N6_9ROSI